MGSIDSATRPLARVSRENPWHSRLWPHRAMRSAAGAGLRTWRFWAMRRDPTRSDPHGLAFLGGLDALDTILQSADYLAITLSLSAATRGLLGTRELGLMKPTAVLINVARAEIVEEAALYHTLAQKTIAGAVLDVWYHYPTAPGPTWPARHAFQELPNVLMTPHVSGWTEGMLEARAQCIAANIHRAARGEPPLHLIPASAA